jgi:G3E family GTPase
MAKRPNDSRVPVTIVTGFLGAGKTTPINHILSHNKGRKVAIIENEFGEVGVDDALVLASKEEIVEMNNGCICCTVRGDLVRILRKLLRRRAKFDGIIIETTGLADPAPVAQTFFVDESLEEELRLDAIVTVMDAKHVMAHLEEVKPEGVENESVEQVAFADVVLLNKVDLVDNAVKASVKNKIKSINGAVEIIECTQSKVDIDRVINIRGFDLSKVLTMEPDFLKDDEHQHDESVTSVGIELEGELDMERLNERLSDLLNNKGADIFRSKGVLAIAGSREKHVFQGVHMLLSIGIATPGWKRNEPRTNRMIFIGRNLDRAQLNTSFKACLAAPSA